MTVEVATKISELVATNPAGSDPKSEGDNHLRLIKGVLQDVFDDSTDNSFEIVGTKTVITRNPLTNVLTISFKDDSDATVGSIGIDAGGLILPDPDAALSSPIRNPVKIVDAASIERARLTANEGAGLANLTIAMKDEAANTRSLLIDPSNIAAGQARTMKLPAAAIDTVPGKWEPIADVAIATGVANYPVVNLAPFRKIRMSGMMLLSSAAIPGWRVSSDNGATWFTGASDYQTLATSTTSTTVAASIANQNYWTFSNTVDAGKFVYFREEMENFNLPLPRVGMGHMYGVATNGFSRMNFRVFNPSPIALNALLLMVNAGTFTGNFSVEGWRG